MLFRSLHALRYDMNHALHTDDQFFLRAFVYCSRELRRHKPNIVYVVVSERT
jgi:hypothetical protein